MFILSALVSFLLVIFVNCQTQKVPNCELSKDVIVQFHGWKYNDIRAECQASQARYYCAFQVPPPFEHQLVDISFPPNGKNPWWQRYHTISWSLEVTDSGTKAEFNQMLKECNDNNIRIYIDFEVNNVGDSTGPGYGSSGGYYDGRPGSYQYPHMSGQSNYHLPNTSPPEGCPTSSGVIEDQNNAEQIRYCSRISVPYTSMTSPTPELNDLKTISASVQSQISGQMNALLNGNDDATRGIAGIRLAHARWVDPAVLRSIVNGIEDVKIPGISGVRPFIYSEVFPDSVIGETEYYDFGQVEEHRAGPLLSDIIRKQHPTYNLANLTLWGEQMGLMASHDAIVFIDDPASQRGWPLLNDLEHTLRYDNPTEYQIANAFMLAHPYGLPRIHSSYHWDRLIVDDAGVDKDVNDYIGPPRDAEDIVQDVVVSADGDSCEGDWNCEHRWLAIRGLARFRNFMKQAGADSVDNFWTNGYHQIAFSRGNRGFIAINNENTKDLNAKIYTGMAAGSYCDLATGSDPTADPCEGRTITVDSSGRADINILAGDLVPFVAFTDFI